MAGIPEYRIMKAIAKHQHFTVKLENTYLLQRLNRMCEKGMVEGAGRKGDYFYFREKGSTWELTK